MVKIAYMFLQLMAKARNEKMLKMVVATKYDWLWIRGYDNYQINRHEPKDTLLCSC